MAPRSEDPKLIIRVINFELVQPICSAYINVTDGRTDRRTDDITIAIPREHYVHRAVKTVETERIEVYCDLRCRRPHEERFR